MRYSTEFKNSICHEMMLMRKKYESFKYALNIIRVKIKVYVNK